MGRVALTEEAFLTQPCYCGHSRERHRRRPGGPTAHCEVCTDGHYFTRPEHHERRMREQAAAGLAAGLGAALRPARSRKGAGGVNGRRVPLEKVAYASDRMLRVLCADEGELLATNDGADRWARDHSARTGHVTYVTRDLRSYWPEAEAVSSEWTPNTWGER